MKFERKYTSRFKRLVNWLFYSSFSIYFVAGITELLLNDNSTSESHLIAYPSALTSLLGTVATILLVLLLFTYIVLIFVEKFEKPKLVKTNVQTYNK